VAALLLLRSQQRATETPAPARASQLVFVLPARKMALPPQPDTASRSLRQPQPAPAAPVPALQPAPVSALQLAPEPALQPASELALQPSAPTVSPLPPPAAPLLTAADIMAQARRDLRKIDKDLLGSAKAIPAQRPDSLQARLARGIDSAFVGDTAEVRDHYTAADGVVYSRITRGGRATCFMNGASTLAAATRSGGQWTQVNCPPPDSGWVR
jgi:hypothetical protein